MNNAKQMMVGLALAMMLSVGLFAAADAEARTAVIRDVENMPVPEGLSMTDVESAVMAGGASRGWTCAPIEDGVAECTLYIRSHMAKVEVKYDTSLYSITYMDSDNLKYDPVKNKIHKNYNSWVQNLNSDIRAELARAMRKR
ncbi:MAG: hypothetical protein AAGA84_02155 [Pseudomonadota bacterium]